MVSKAGLTRAQKQAMLAKASKSTTKPPVLTKIAEAQHRLARSAKRASGLGPFQGVTEVTSAPVTLGNTVRSVGMTVQKTGAGVVVTGRDYMSTVGGTSTAYSGWTLQTGMGVTPMALNASSLRGYFQSHERFRARRMVAHFITSSPTSLAGDVMIIYHQNHGGPKVDHTSNNFLSYALSTTSAVIGPQWTNHSAEVHVTGKWVGTDVLNSEDVEHQADGEILVYTKNTTNGSQADAPGYIILDYVFEFDGLMTNPRLATLPSGIFKWFPSAASFSGTIGSAFDPAFIDVGTANTYSGSTGTVPPSTPVGTIFQIVLDFQAATFGGTLSSGSQATMWSVVSARQASGAVARVLVYPVTTGSTLYAVYRSGTTLELYPSYDAVFAGNEMVWSASSAGCAFTCAAVLCAVGSVNAQFAQANIG